MLSGLSLLSDPLVNLLSMHWGFLWCVYPDFGLAASAEEDMQSVKDSGT